MDSQNYRNWSWSLTFITCFNHISVIKVCNSHKYVRNTCLSVRYIKSKIYLEIKMYIRTNRNITYNVIIVEHVNHHIEYFGEKKTTTYNYDLHGGVMSWRWRPLLLCPEWRSYIHRNSLILCIYTDHWIFKMHEYEVLEGTQMYTISDVTNNMLSSSFFFLT